MIFNFNLFSIIALLISIITLVVHLKNRKTNLKSFSITNKSHKRTFYDLIFIETQNNDTNHIAKLVVFNPSSVSLLINCIKVYRKDSDWKQIDIKWWPSDRADFSKEKFLQDEYENLLVDNFKNIFVQIPGRISNKLHKFEIITSFGKMSHITTITGSKTSFNIEYNRTYYD